MGGLVYDGSSWLRTPAETEAAVAAWMARLGFTDVVMTQASGDGGIDVTSKEAVAQVKAAMSPTGRPALQALVGAATVEGKVPMFFSAAGYTAEATRWADRAGLALFAFDRRGQVDVGNDAAERLLEALARPDDATGPQPDMTVSDEPPTAVTFGPQRLLVRGRVSSPVVHDGVAYAMAQEAAGAFRLVSIDLRSGRRVEPSWGDLGSLRLPLFSGDVAYVSTGHGATRYDLTSRRVVWRADGVGSPAAASADVLLCEGVRHSEYSPVLACLAARTGRVRWELDLSGHAARSVVAGVHLAGSAVVVQLRPPGEAMLSDGGYDLQAPWFGALFGVDLRAGTVLWKLDDVAAHGMAVGSERAFVLAVRPDPFEVRAVSMDVRSGREEFTSDNLWDLSLGTVLLVDLASAAGRAWMSTPWSFGHLEVDDPSGSESWPRDVNDLVQLVGAARDVAFEFAFESQTLRAVNASGTTIGTSDRCEGLVSRAVVADGHVLWTDPLVGLYAAEASVSYS